MKTKSVKAVVEQPKRVARGSLRRMVKRHTAWTLAGDWWWVDSHMARIAGGKKLWETVTAPERGNGKTVRLWRLDGLKQYVRWIPHNTRMELVPLNDGTQRGRDAEATNATETQSRPSLK